MNRHIIFDFDGTIVDSVALAVDIYNQLADKYNLRKLELADIESLKNLSISERLKLFKVPLYLLPKMAIEFKGEYQKHVGTLEAIEGIQDTILEMKRLGYPLSIVSSNSVTNIQKFLDNTKIDVFDHIYSSKALFGKQKILKQVMRKLKIGQDQVLYIGDELRDIVSCKKASVPMVAVTWGFDSKALLSSGNPEFIVNKPAEILQTLA